MAVVFERTVSSAASPEAVFQVWADVASWPEWTGSVTSVEPRPGALPLREGSVFRLRQPWLMPAEWTVSTLEPGRSFGWTSAAPGTVTVASHDVVAVGPGSLVTARLEMTGLGARPAKLLLGRLVERYLDLETQGVVRRAEGAG